MGIPSFSQWKQLVQSNNIEAANQYAQKKLDKWNSHKVLWGRFLDEYENGNYLEDNKKSIQTIGHLIEEKITNLTRKLDPTSHHALQERSIFQLSNEKMIKKYHIHNVLDTFFGPWGLKRKIHINYINEEVYRGISDLYEEFINKYESLSVSLKQIKIEAAFIVTKMTTLNRPAELIASRPNPMKSKVSIFIDEFHLPKITNNEIENPLKKQKIQRSLVRTNGVSDLSIEIKNPVHVFPVSSRVSNATKERFKQAFWRPKRFAGDQYSENSHILIMPKELKVDDSEAVKPWLKLANQNHQLIIKPLKLDEPKCSAAFLQSSIFAAEFNPLESGFIESLYIDLKNPSNTLFTPPYEDGSAVFIALAAAALLNEYPLLTPLDIRHCLLLGATPLILNDKKGVIADKKMMVEFRQFKSPSKELPDVEIKMLKGSHHSKVMQTKLKFGVGMLDLEGARLVAKGLMFRKYHP